MYAETLTAVGEVKAKKNVNDTLTVFTISGDHSGLNWKPRGSLDGTNWIDLAFTPLDTNVPTAAGTIAPNAGVTSAVMCNTAGLNHVEAYVTALTATYSVTATISSAAPLGQLLPPAVLPTSGGLQSTSPTAGIGYAAGSGGAVTQATSITTGVTLNKVSGKITTVVATLAAGVDASFTLTNSTIGANDVVVPSIKSYAGTPDGIPVVEVVATAAGSCVFNIRNTGAVALDALIVINFVVLKGSES